MRLGGPVFERVDGPAGWIAALKRLGYSTAYCPVDELADDATVRAYADAADKASLIIAEVGIWNNPLSTDEEKRRHAIEKCVSKLDLADRIGALCTVNIAGSLGPQWDGPFPADLTDEAFDLVVQTVREIIDDVKPKRAFYTLEPMPWMYPESPDDYLRLINAIDRRQFGVHLDPANWMNSPPRFLHNDAFIRECYRKLGPYVKAVHLKDTRLNPGLSTLLEHLKTPEEYDHAAHYVRQEAKRARVAIKTLA